MRLRRTGTVRRLAALIAVTALTWGFAPSAVAGGPTSVLITSPESAETAALYNSDAEYEALSKQLGGEGMGVLPEGRKKRPGSLDSAMGSRQINVTWMVHDVQPWRLDRVYPGADTSEIWIHTTTDMRGQETGVWHQAEQPAALRALLMKIGVMGEKTAQGAGPAVPPAGGTDEAEEREETAGSTDGGADGRWWAIPALGAGVVLGLVLRPLAGRLPRPPRRRGGGRPQAGPRGQLLDV
ncbi:hypothetical protein OG705_22040 [Streptomyces sp. NBC_00838]|uniref:hypothetical protein n=1 Tax=Streptomyces sp. NBC_00838 TaxID=2903680 RepID=UPI00386F5F6B|nr:hypothetical protein OG705_22040 [Streptomyces sp. NBC_00838]